MSMPSVPAGSRNLPEDFYEPAEYTELIKPPKEAKKQKGGCSHLGGWDLVSAIAVVLIPFWIFTAESWVIAFFHYKTAWASWLVILLGLAAVALAALFALRSLAKESGRVNYHQTVWAVVGLLAMLIAFFGGLHIGWQNYIKHVRPIYELRDLNTYDAVDASAADGKAYMDAGVITFKKGAHIDQSKSVGFMNLDMYCVAPIVSDTTPANQSYDFWAIGMNCCTGAGNDFHCGSFTDKHAKGGIRLMDNTQFGFYKLASQMAETQYGIKVAHPLFFTWVSDGPEHLTDLEDKGDKFFWHSEICMAIVLGVLALMALFVASFVRNKSE